MTVKMGSFERMRNVMIAFSVLISLSGTGLLAIACLLLLYPSGPGDALSVSNALFIGTIYAVALSVVLLVLGILGSIAAFRKNRCLLMVCFLLILLMCMVELAAGILAFLFRDQLTKLYFEEELRGYYMGANITDAYTESCDSVMIRFECCGVNGPRDFLFNPHPDVPAACCKRYEATKNGIILDVKKCITGEAEFINSQGCFDVLGPKVEMILYLTGGLSIWILIIQICVMIFAIWLFQRA
ncbi:tetraspanin-18-like [Rhinoraja longicauda]